MFQTDLLNLQFLKRKSIKEKFSGENFSLLVVDNVRRFLLELSCKMLTILLHSEQLLLTRLIRFNFRAGKKEKKKITEQQEICWWQQISQLFGLTEMVKSISINICNFYNQFFFLVFGWCILISWVIDILQSCISMFVYIYWCMPPSNSVQQKSKK